MLVVASTSIVKSQTVVVVDNVDGTSTYHNSVDLSGFNSTINDNTNWVNQDEAESKAAQVKLLAVELYRSNQIRKLEEKIHEVDEQINTSLRKINDLKRSLENEKAELPILIFNIKQKEEKLKRDFAKKMAEYFTPLHEQIMEEYDNASDVKKGQMIYGLLTNPGFFLAQRSLVPGILIIQGALTFQDEYDKFSNDLEDLGRSRRKLESRLDDVNRYLAGSLGYQPIIDEENFIDYLNVQKTSYLDKIKWWRVVNIIFDESIMMEEWMAVHLGSQEDGGGFQNQRIGVH